MQTILTSSKSETAEQDRVSLCIGIFPIWLRHLATSRAQSEVAVTEMLQAFADIGPHIHRAERQSVQITEALRQSDGGVTGLVQACERLLAPVLHDPSTHENTKTALEQVLATVGRAVDSLEEIAQPFSHETQMVAAQVERMYIGFQYQDRISQMMALLEGDIARLQTALAGNDAAIPTLSGWLEHLESQYAMAEQRKDHQAHSSGTGDVPDSNETTFF